MDKPGAQEYYNSLFELYAKWGVDFVKVDDISSPFSEKEIIAIRKAIDQCGRPMVLSLSPGETPIKKAEAVKELANMWRISNDFWDNWKALNTMFTLLHTWESHIGPGHFPDADMLIMGLISRRGPVGEPRRSNFANNELTTMMTLWCIARSPLIYGGDMSMMRPNELKMLQNKAVIAVNQNSTNNRQLFRNEDQVVWIADVPGTNDKYLAVFNLGDKGQFIHIDLNDLGFNGVCSVTDLWLGDYLGTFESGMRPEVLPHGARLFRVSKQ
jgi:alpha-galactosidase